MSEETNKITKRDIGRFTFDDYRKVAMTKLSREVLPIGTKVETLEGEYTCAEESRLAIDASENVYPVAESIFRKTYVIERPSSPPSPLVERIEELRKRFQDIVDSPPGNHIRDVIAVCGVDRDSRMLLFSPELSAALRPADDGKRVGEQLAELLKEREEAMDSRMPDAIEAVDYSLDYLVRHHAEIFLDAAAVAKERDALKAALRLLADAYLRGAGHTAAAQAALAQPGNEGGKG